MACLLSAKERLISAWQSAQRAAPDIGGGLELERVRGAIGSARFDLSGGLDPGLLLDEGAAKEPRCLGVRSVGQQVCEDLPGIRRLASPKQRPRQEQAELAHRLGSGGMSLWIELKEPAEGLDRPGGIVQLGGAVPRIRRPRASHPGCRTSCSATTSAALSRSFCR